MLDDILKKETYEIIENLYRAFLIESLEAIRLDFDSVSDEDFFSARESFIRTLERAKEDGEVGSCLTGDPETILEITTLALMPNEKRNALLLRKFKEWEASLDVEN